MPATEVHSLWQTWQSTANEQAFADLVCPEVRYAVDLARRVGASPTEADDVVQNALVQLASETGSAPIDVGIRAWLGRRVVLGVKMLIRSSVRRRRHERRASRKTTRRAALAQPRSTLDARDETEAALARLAPLERQSIVLRYLYDLDYREMAYVLGISAGACRLRVHRASKRLRAEFGKTGAHVALLVVPLFARESALLGAALSTSKVAVGAGAAIGSGSAAAGIGAAAATKSTTVGAGLLAAAALTAGVVVSANDEPPPPPPPTPIIQASEPAAEVPKRPAKPAALALLDDHFARKKSAAETLWDFDKIRGLMGKVKGGTVRLHSRRAITYVDLDRVASTADRIELGPGTFRITKGLRITTQSGYLLQIGTDGVKFRRHHGERGDRVIELVGAGVGKTFVRTSNDILSVDGGSTFAGLHVQDLTLTCYEPERKYAGLLFSIREGGRGVVTCDRVRFLGWASGGLGGPGGHTGQALSAFRHCSFIGGYRRRTGGNALAMRGPGLALFDQCKFFDLRAAISTGGSELPPGGLAHFTNCTFSNAPILWARKRNTSAPRGMLPFSAHVRGGSVALGWKDQSRAQRRQTFGARLAEGSDALPFTVEPTRVTIVDLRAVLEAYEVPAGRQVIGVRAYTWEGAERTAYAITTHDAKRDPKIDLRYLDKGLLSPAPARTFDLRNGDRYDHRAARPLVDLLRDAWDRLDPERPLGGLRRRVASGGEGVRLYDRNGRRVR